MSKRIQRRRTKGWTMPGNAVYVGRPTKFGNPFLFSEHGEKTLNLYREHLASEVDLGRIHVDDLDALRGKDLACWCPPGSPCHVDVLLEIVNA